MKLYTIYDNVAEEGGPLFEAKNDGVASRMAQTTLAKVPPYLISDYTLMRVGEVELHNGNLQGQILDEFVKVPFIKALEEDVNEK